MVAALLLFVLIVAGNVAGAVILGGSIALKAVLVGLAAVGTVGLFQRLASIINSWRLRAGVVLALAAAVTGGLATTTNSAWEWTAVVPYLALCWLGSINYFAGRRDQASTKRQGWRAKRGAPQRRQCRHLRARLSLPGPCRWDADVIGHLRPCLQALIDGPSASARSGPNREKRSRRRASEVRCGLRPEPGAPARGATVACPAPHAVSGFDTPVKSSQMTQVEKHGMDKSGCSTPVVVPREGLWPPDARRRPTGDWRIVGEALKSS